MTGSQLVVITLKSDQRLVTARLTSGERIAWRLSCVLRVNSRFRLYLKGSERALIWSSCGRMISVVTFASIDIFEAISDQAPTALYLYTVFCPIQHFIASATSTSVLYSHRNPIIEFLYPQVHVDFSKKAFAFDTQIQDMIVRKYIIRSCDRENKLNGGKIRLQLPQLVDS